MADKDWFEFEDDTEDDELFQMLDDFSLDDLNDEEEEDLSDRYARNAYEITYREVPGGWNVKSILCSEVDVLILPSEHEGRPVVGIDGDSLGEAGHVSHLVFPETMRRVSPVTLSSVDSYSVAENNPYFKVSGDMLLSHDERKLVALCWRMNQRSFRIPDGVEIIGECAFSRCWMLKEIIIPDSVKRIENAAFAHAGIEKIVIPDSVKILGTDCFRDCHQLRQVILPADLDELPGEIFSGCLSLEEFPRCDKVKHIGSYAFSGCLSLHRIDLPEHVKLLGKGCFSFCRSLEEVSLPEGVDFIPEAAFWDCRRMKKLTMGPVVGIGSRAFRDCQSLKEIIFPETLRLLASAAFEKCGGLKRVTFCGRNTELMLQSFMYCRDVAVVVPQGSSTEASADSLAFNEPDTIHIEYLS